MGAFANSFGVFTPFIQSMMSERATAQRQKTQLDFAREQEARRQAEWEQQYQSEAQARQHARGQADLQTELALRQMGARPIEQSPEGAQVTSSVPYNVGALPAAPVSAPPTVSTAEILSQYARTPGAQQSIDLPRAPNAGQVASTPAGRQWEIPTVAEANEMAARRKVAEMVAEGGAKQQIETARRQAEGVPAFDLLTAAGYDPDQLSPALRRVMVTPDEFRSIFPVYGRVITTGMQQEGANTRNANTVEGRITTTGMTAGSREKVAETNAGARQAVAATNAGARRYAVDNRPQPRPAVGTVQGYMRVNQNLNKARADLGVMEEQLATGTAIGANGLSYPMNPTQKAVMQSRVRSQRQAIADLERDKSTHEKVLQAQGIDLRQIGANATPGTVQAAGPVQPASPRVFQDQAQASQAREGDVFAYPSGRRVQLQKDQRGNLVWVPLP